MSSGARIHKIEPTFLDKIWGSPRIEPWFGSRGGRLTGEVWFPADDLLVKFLFTSQNLSVQVHPGDEYARLHEHSRGKTEMWQILRADPGARIAVGLKEPVTPEKLVAAAQSGEIMELLNWIEVAPGQTYFIPAGTIHAIGAGLALCEIQQNSDVTYRLFDYGRDRELHLDKARAVSDCGAYDGLVKPTSWDGLQLLVDCPYFRTSSAKVRERLTLRARLVAVVGGSGTLNGERARAGEVWQTEEAGDWLVDPLEGGLELLAIE